MQSGKGKKLVSLDVAARRLGTTQLHLLMQVRGGSVPAAEVDGRWMLDAEALELLLKRKAAGGLPVVCKSGCARSGGCASCG